MKTRVGLYIHVPFCTNKCGYCDFNSWAETRRAPQLQWLEGVKRQISIWLDKWNRLGCEVEFDSIFFGGGTPSLMDADVLSSLGAFLKSHRANSPLEFTAECNPETLDLEKLDALCEMGVNRLSIGIQSFDDKYLERLERKARRSDNLRALDLVSQKWSGSWSLDLMFALPEQTLDHWQETLDQALFYEPSHLSAYQLTLSTARSLHWKQAGEDELLKFFDLTEEKLFQHSLFRYEVSNFSKPGFESLHNLKYWRIHPFLGVGPGAYGLLSSDLLGDVKDKSLLGYHQKNPSAIEAWLESSKSELAEIQKLEPRSSKDHVFELLMMGFRLNEGVPKSQFGGLESFLEDLFQKPIYSNYINTLGASWVLSPEGLRILDGLLPGIFQKIEDFLKKLGPQDLDLAVFEPKF